MCAPQGFPLPAELHRPEGPSSGAGVPSALHPRGDPGRPGGQPAVAGLPAARRGCYACKGVQCLMQGCGQGDPARTPGAACPGSSPAPPLLRRLLPAGAGGPVGGGARSIPRSAAPSAAPCHCRQTRSAPRPPARRPPAVPLSAPQWEADLTPLDEAAVRQMLGLVDAAQGALLAQEAELEALEEEQRARRRRGFVGWVLVWAVVSCYPWGAAGGTSRP